MRKILFSHVMPVLLAALLGLSGCASGSAAPSPTPAAAQGSPAAQSPSPAPPADPGHAEIQRALDEAGEDVYQVTWSPDGAMALFLRETDGQICLWKTGQAEPVVLCPDTGTTSGFSWSPDGSRFLINVGHMGPDTITTAVYDAATAAQLGAELTSAKPSSPLWSPDGNRLALSRMDEESGTVTLSLLFLPDGTETELFRAENPWGPLILNSWNADGTLRFTQTTDTGAEIASAVQAN